MSVTLDYPYDTAAIKQLYDTDTWHTIPTRSVALVDLQPTQQDIDIVSIRQLARGVPPREGDPYPHVVLHDGWHYIHNGHHRYVIALSRADGWLNCRVVNESGEPA